MKTVICDDEPLFRAQLSELIRKEDEDACVLEADSAEDLMEIAKDAQLIFLDIQMEGTDGVTAARRLRENGFSIPIIFVTAVKDYIFDAFDVDAFWYLIKPVNEADFRYVYRKAKNSIIRQKGAEKLIFHTKKTTYSLSPGQILYVENDRKKVILHTKDENIVIYASMQEMEEKLGEQFYRCHRGYLVNLEHIDAYGRDAIHLDDGSAVYLAREKYAEFTKIYMKYLGEELD